MITVQETTIWSDPTPNHKYILSDDRMFAYGYIKVGQELPHIFNQPIGFNARGRKFVVLTRTKDVDQSVKSWTVQGSTGNSYTVSMREGEYSCTCPAAMYRHKECKHILEIKKANK